MNILTFICRYLVINSLHLDFAVHPLLHPRKLNGCFMRLISISYQRTITCGDYVPQSFPWTVPIAKSNIKYSLMHQHAHVLELLQRQQN